MDQGSLEPAAIQFALEHLQESARRSGYFLCMHSNHSICVASYVKFIPLITCQRPFLVSSDHCAGLERSASPL